MKLGRLSLIAALAIASATQADEIKYDKTLAVTTVDKSYVDKAIEASKTLKFEGQLKFWYQTMDHDGLSNGKADKGLFQRDPNQPNEWGNVEAQFSVSGNINEHLYAKTTLMTVSTMGMDSAITAGQTARPGQFGSSNASDAQPFWVHEMFLDYKLSKSTDVKIGRMELDTPLIYTEKWNATANSFEAITAANTDLPNTTLLAGWVSKGNGATDNLLYAPQVFGAESQFSDFMGYQYSTTTSYYVPAGGGTITNTKVNADDVLVTTSTTTKKLSDGGALFLGAKNNSLSFMPLQAWAYYAPDAAQAFWIQADPTMKELGFVDVASMQLIAAGNGATGATDSFLQTDVESNGNDKTQMTQSLAAKVALSSGMFNAYAAYSANSKGNLPVANMGTNYKKTKLPTASIFNDGMTAAQPDTTAWKLGVGAKFDGIGTLALSYGQYSVGQNEGYQNINKNAGGPASMGYIAQNFVGDDMDVKELDVVFKTKVSDVDLAAMYIKVNQTYVPILGNSAANGGTTLNYGTYGNDIVRIIATLKF